MSGINFIFLSSRIYVDLNSRNSRSVSNSVVELKESRSKTLHQILHRVLTTLHIAQQLSTVRLEIKSIVDHFSFENIISLSWETWCRSLADGQPLTFRWPIQFFRPRRIPLPSNCNMQHPKHWPICAWSRFLRRPWTCISWPLTTLTARE